jgi:hypothetical protein
MMKSIALLFLIPGALTLLAAQDTPGLLTRNYREGETMQYSMKGLNERWAYEVHASVVVKKNAAGKFIEEFAWSNLKSNGQPLPLPAGTLDFRQILSLDPGVNPSVPNLAQVSPMLIGPITDMLSFYADLWLASRQGKLNHAGDHAFQKHGTPASWADANYVMLGEDSIDFDITLVSVDESKRVATLLVKHVPPKQPQVKLPAAWMREPVAGTPNNWIDVSKKDGKFIAAVGKETFDVTIKISLPDGKILSGTIENPVEARERDCTDSAYMNCGDPRPRHIMRKIEVTLDR